MQMKSGLQLRQGKDSPPPPAIWTDFWVMFVATGSCSKP